MTPNGTPPRKTEQPTEQRLNTDPTATEQTLAVAVAALTAQLAEKDGQLAARDGEIREMRAGYERQIAEQHVLLQGAQRLIPATVTEHAAETRSDAPRDAQREATTNHAAGAPEAAGRVTERVPGLFAGWRARLNRRRGRE